jgi:EAL domain-containing protein (putative c-di-GMP-specific phosphodiesterase class I)
VQQSLVGLVALVVEEDDFQRRTVARMLRSLGIPEVQEAADGQQALSLMQDKHCVNLVVCGLDMPQMDGMEFIRHLGEVDRNVSVIIASAQEKTLLDSVAKMASAYDIRVLGTIEKPVSLHVLTELIALHEPPCSQRAQESERTPHFSLEEILHGVQAKQFETFFQPKVDLASGRVLGAEALARWRHPEHGAIAPYAFIAALEESGEIWQLTLQMLQKAALACSAWRKRDPEFTVSVNLSPVTLSNTNQADRITETVRSAGLDPLHMVLEITETAAMTEVAHALENLARLRINGFGLSVDDYGTGFSHLQQLMRMPITELKIDRSFVKNCSTNPSSFAIVESSVQMAQRMNLKCVAEGVETQADWDALKATSCDFAQGYFFGGPMDDKSIQTYFATDRTTIRAQ